MSLMHKLLARRYPGLEHVPGPTPRLPLGNLEDFLHGQPWRLSLDYAERYGPFALTWVFDQPVLFVHDPDAIEEIVVGKRAYFIKDEPAAALRPAASDSNFFVANGADWAARRRSDFFSEERASDWLRERFEPTQAFLRRKLESLLPLERVERIERHVYRLLFDLQCFLVFGRRMRDEDFRHYNRMTEAVNLRMAPNLPLYGPPFHRTLNKWHEAVAEQLEASEEQPEGRSLSHLWSRHGRLPRPQLVTELANVFPGGSFSMTAAVVHALCCLSASGRERERVREELLALGEAGPPSYDQLCESALEGVVREAMRVYAPVPVLLRRVKADEVEIGSLRLPKGLRVAIGALPLQRDEGHWRHAREFIPTRWTPEVIAANPYGSAYFFPFGRGPRHCAGQELGLFVIRSVLYALLSDPQREFDLRMPAAHRYFFGCMMPKQVFGTMR